MSDEFINGWKDGWTDGWMSWSCLQSHRELLP